MSLTAREIAAVVAELAPLAGAHVEAVRVHAERALTLSLRGRAGEALLLLSAEPDVTRLHAAARRPRQPDAPFPFQALLRRELEGARLTALETLPGDRVTLTVARSVARVPNVIGRSKRAAIATMQRNGYEVLVRRVETSVTDAGRILSTLPAAGAQLPPRSTVVLRLAVSPRCDPNYTGFCVPNVSYDLNCADIGHMVRVVGDDRFGFDGDGNGWGCEAYG